MTLLWRTAAVFVPVWLAGTVGQLEKARRELAQNAVLRERLQLDDRLRVTLRARWPRSWPAGSGPRRRRMAIRPRPGGTAALAETSGASGRAPAAFSALHRPSPAELETAASLLTAAGIPTRLALQLATRPRTSARRLAQSCGRLTARQPRGDVDRACLIGVTPGRAAAAGTGSRQEAGRAGGRRVSELTVTQASGFSAWAAAGRCGS